MVPGQFNSRRFVGRVEERDPTTTVEMVTVGSHKGLDPTYESPVLRIELPCMVLAARCKKGGSSSSDLGDRDCRPTVDLKCLPFEGRVGDRINQLAGAGIIPTPAD